MPTYISVTVVLQLRPKISTKNRKKGIQSMEKRATYFMHFKMRLPKADHCPQGAKIKNWGIGNNALFDNFVKELGVLAAPITAFKVWFGMNQFCANDWHRWAWVCRSFFFFKVKFSLLLILQKKKKEMQRFRRGNLKLRAELRIYVQHFLYSSL